MPDVEHCRHVEPIVLQLRVFSVRAACNEENNAIKLSLQENFNAAACVRASRSRTAQLTCGTACFARNVAPFTDGTSARVDMMRIVAQDMLEEVAWFTGLLLPCNCCCKVQRW